MDQTDGFVFGFSKLDVMFGRKSPEAVRHQYSEPVRPGVRFVQSTIRAIDPAARRVDTDAGTFEADIMVVALGADLHPERRPGWSRRAMSSTPRRARFALRDVLERFEGGQVIVAVTSTPFKCPPAPSETALLMHDHLITSGLRERSSIALVMPLGAPIPPSPAASAVLLQRFAESDIAWHPERLVRGWTRTPGGPAQRRGELPYDLFLAVPVHRAPAVVVAAGLTVDGWIPVDPVTLETRFPGVYAVGRRHERRYPKAGVFAEGQAAVVAERIAAQVRGEAASAGYDGRGVCYLEVGRGQCREGGRHVPQRTDTGRWPRGPVGGPRGGQGCSSARAESSAGSASTTC